MFGFDPNLHIVGLGLLNSKGIGLSVLDQIQILDRRSRVSKWSLDQSVVYDTWRLKSNNPGV